jgi:broad specificity phosphatase PhoE
LREKSWGIHEGMSFQEIESTGIKYKDFNQWIEALDGESVESYKERVEKYFFETILRESASEVLVMTHAGVIKTLLSIIKKIPLEKAFALPLPYSSSLDIEFKEGSLKILSV